MRNIVLGNTGTSVSAVSLGAWAYGGPQKLGPRHTGWSDQQDDDSTNTLLRCNEIGIRHWDTADVYGDGKSEKIIGSIWDKLSRSNIFLATKTGYDSGQYKHYYHPDHMRKQMEQSLINLRTDYVDLYYLHHCDFGDHDEYFSDALEMVQRFREEGKTRFIGLSDWDASKIMKFIDVVKPDVIQPYRNLMNDSFVSSGLKNWVNDHNIGVCFFSPIMHGLLTGKYKQPTNFKPGDMRAGIAEFTNIEIIKKLRENKTLLESRFAAHPNPVMHGIVDSLLTDTETSCVLLGQRNVEQANVAATLGQKMSDADSDWVKSLYRF